MDIDQRCEGGERRATILGVTEALVKQSVSNASLTEDTFYLCHLCGV
jgi:hypothetical protein